MFKLYETVKLKNQDILDSENIIGTVLYIYDSAPPQYEVEFCDNLGGTVAILTVAESDIEPTNMT